MTAHPNKEVRDLIRDVRRDAREVAVEQERKAVERLTQESRVTHDGETKDASEQREADVAPT